MASLVFAGPFYQEAESIEITIKDRFFDKDYPSTNGYFNDNSFCYTDDLLIEVKLTLSQTNAMGIDDGFYDRAIDLRDWTIDDDDTDDHFIMNWEVYCGFPVYGPQGDVVDLTRGFTVTFNEGGQLNWIREIFDDQNFLDNPN